MKEKRRKNRWVYENKIIITKSNSIFLLTVMKTVSFTWRVKSPWGLMNNQRTTIKEKKENIVVNESNNLNNIEKSEFSINSVFPKRLKTSIGHKILCLQILLRIWVVAINSHFLILIFLQSYSVNLWYFKLRSFNLTELIGWKFERFKLLDCKCV